MKKFKVCLFIFMVCIFYNVNALEQDNLVEIIDNKITFDTYTTDFSFKQDLEENEVISNCYGENNHLTCECTEGMCYVKLDNYGIFNISLNIYDSSDNSSNTKNIYVDNATNKYLEYVAKKIPNEIHVKNNSEIYSLLSDYAPNGVNIDYEYGDVFKDYQVYNLTIKYTYNESNEYKYISKEKSVKVYNDNSNTYYYIDLFKNATYSLTNIYGFSNIQFKNYIFFSENEDIATISSKGIIKGINSGTTYIRVYNTTDLSSYKILVNVKGDKIEDVDIFKQMFDNKEVNINASTYDYFESYVDNDYQNNTYEINYERLVDSYINQQFNNRVSKDYSLYYNYDDIDRIICEDNICNVKLTYYHRTSLKTIVISNIKVNVTGLILRSNHFSVGNKTNIEYYSFLKNNDNIELIYDEDYFVKDEDFALTPIKAGETSITIKSLSIDGVYISTRKVSIYDYNLSNNFNEYINNLNEIELPYKETNFSDISDLDLLEQIISNKIYNDVELDSDLKNYLSIDTYCITNDKCLVSINLRTSNTLIANSYNKVISIKFNNTKDLEEIIRNYNNITDMFIDTIDVVKLKDLDGTFDDNVLKKLGYKSLSNVVITKITDEYIKNNVLKDSIYNIKFIDNENKLFEKNITITYNFIITMSISLDSSDESKVSYLNTYYNSILNKSISIENINNDIYKINNDYEIILDKKDEIYYNQISVCERGIELGVNEEFQIELYYYPIYANTGKAKITSFDDSVAKVTDDGIITALKKGFTYIEVEYGHCISRVLVAVDMTIKEVLNSYLDKLPDSVIVQYSSLRYTELEYAIGSELSSSVNQFSLGIDITEDNGKYYAAITNFDETSDKKEIKYEIKGIDTSKEYYSLNVGEEVDTKLYFSEGDNSNIVISNYDGIVSMTEDGIMKGLKKGITTIYFNDIYNQYYNNITVIVNKDEVLEDFINLYKDKTIYVNQKDFSYWNRYDSENNEYYGYDFETEVGYALDKVNRDFYYYKLYYSRDINCDTFDETGLCTITFTNLIYDFEDISFDIKVIKEGIYLEEKEKSLSIDEEYIPKYTLYNTDGIEIKSLNTDVCIIEDNKIKGINTGMCNVLFTSGDYFNYMHFVVDIDGFNNLIKEEIDNLPSVYALEMDEVDFSIVDNYDTELVYNNMNRIISDSVTNKNLGEFYFTFTNNADVRFFIRHNGYLNFYDSKTDYSYTYNLNYNKIEIAEKEIEINYTGYTNEERDIINRLDNELDKKYELTLSQYIEYELNKKEETFYEMFEYTEFYDKLDEICNGECEIELNGGYGCDIPGNILVGIGAIISYKGKPIYIDSYEVKNTYTIEVTNNISEEVFIEKIKEDFKKAYNAAKENIKNLRSIRSYNMTNLYNALEPSMVKLASDEVTVKKGFNKELLLPEYTLSIEDYTMTLVVNTLKKEELIYNTKLINYELNTYDVSLDVGSKKQIDIIFNPSNATNKEVSYKSMDESIATVKDGLITAVKEGTTIVQVISKDGNITKEIKVVVNSNKEVVLGDVTGDGIVNISDLVTFRKYLANKTTISEERLKNVDLNNDGKINITDLIRLRKMLAK